MTRIAAPGSELLSQCAPLLAQAENTMGYRPNDVLSLCHWPELLHSLGGLVETVLQTGEVDPTLKRLIGIISSRTQGCTYCTAHSSYGANQLGLKLTKSPPSLSSKRRRFSVMQSGLCSVSHGTGLCNPMQSVMRISLSLRSTSRSGRSSKLWLCCRSTVFSIGGTAP